ncbi:MAG: hypothetical protein AAFY47_07575 [Pseudomonadota bacterium]
MSREILTSATRTQCPHGGTGTLNASQGKVMIEGSPALVFGDQGTVAGCGFTLPNGKPQPCVTQKLLGASTKVFAQGTPVLLKNPTDLSYSAENIPQGPVTWSTVQAKVTAI